MSQEIHVEIKEDHLLAVFSGKFEYQTNRELLLDILMECIKNSKTRVLFDLRLLKGNMTTYERYETATYLANLTRQHQDTSKLQIAVVGNEPLIDPERFGETVAKNKGLNIKVSNDMNEVVEWLGIKK